MYSSFLQTASIAAVSLLGIACASPAPIELARGSALDAPLSETFSAELTARNSLLSISEEQMDWADLAQMSNAKQAYAGDRALVSQRTTLPTKPGGQADVLTAEVSISAENLPLNALLRALAQQLSLAIHFSEPLATEVNWIIPSQPAFDVLNQLAERYDLHWSLRNGVLDIRGPTPFTAFYAVDYLNMERQFNSNVGLATEVGTMRGLNESGGAATENSSSTTITNASRQAFWASLSNDLSVWLAGPSDSNNERAAIHTKWAVNADAGLISLHSSPNTHRRLKEYLAQLKSASRRQVLIEASVVEVLLSDDFEVGIDWQWLARGLDGITAIQQLHGLGPLTGDSVARAPTPSGLVTFSQRYQQGDFAATFQLLERFGDVRIVSRPQILAMNNQPAVLKVVDNRVYFTVNVERQQSAESVERYTQTRIHTVPVGLVMSVTPHISDGNDVMLNVRPSLSRILGFVDDPNPELNTASVRNGVPEIQVREMESVLRVPSGRIAVIGGLMQSVQDDRDRQLPGLANLPGIGALFKQTKQQRKRTELFIVLKPTVLGADTGSNIAMGGS